jgi:hypothetical protein
MHQLMQMLGLPHFEKIVAKVILYNLIDKMANPPCFVPLKQGHLQFWGYAVLDVPFVVSLLMNHRAFFSSKGIESNTTVMLMSRSS